MDELLNHLLEGFKSPPAEFRPQYLWFLNHEMEIAEVNHQLDVMKQAGAGGAFLHSRTGRITPYMGEKWLAMVTAAIKHGREIGMKVWLYDEDGFPSGYAGGKTVERDPKEYAANFIVLVDEFELKPGENIDAEIKLEHPTSEFFGAVAVKVKEAAAGIELDEYPSGAIDISRDFHSGRLQWQAPGRGTSWLVLVFAREWNPASANVLSKDAMIAFVEETHEKYARYFKEAGIDKELGVTIPGIFTDEPGIMYCLGNKGWRRIIPYTRGMDDLYQQKHAIPFLMGLPPVFFEVDNGDPRYRLDFWNLAGDLYQDAFFKTSHDWCKEHGIVLMGHVANEGNLYNQVRDQVNFFMGARYMGFGCSDQLGSVFRAEFERQYTLANCDNMVAPRYASSAANVFNLPRTNSECFGSAGWELSLEQQKRLVDWQVSQGVNLFIPHDYSYSIEGERKRDHPPAFNACAYFEEINVLNDYMGRLCFLFSQVGANEFPKIGFLYGNTSILASMSPMMGNAAYRAHEAQPYIIDLLQRLHYEFDIIPEEYMVQLHHEHGIFYDGRNAYDVIILPSLETINASTARKLLDYYNAGGKVLFVQNIPRQFYGRTMEDKMAGELFSCLDLRPEDIDESLKHGELISGRHQLIMSCNDENGVIALLQAPRNPIHANHLLHDLDSFISRYKLHELGATMRQGDGKTDCEIGEIVTRRLDFGGASNVAVVFAANVSGTMYKDVTIFIKGNKNGNRIWRDPMILKLDPLNGESCGIFDDEWNLDDDGNASFSCDFQPSESKLFLICEKERIDDMGSIARKRLDRMMDFHPVQLKGLDSCAITPAKLNIVNLDEWRSTFSVDKMGIERPSYLECKITQDITILVVNEIPSALHLIIDGITTHAPGSMIIRVNGKNIPPPRRGSMLDPMMLQSTNIAGLFTMGKNIVSVTVSGCLGSPVYPLSEPVRLAGDFVARKDESGTWILSKFLPPLKSGFVNLATNGFPHYVFPVDYDLSFEIDEPADPGARYYLVLPRMNCPLYKIWLNGTLTGHAWFGAYTIELKNVVQGTNSLKIRYYPYPTNLYESTTTSTGITGQLSIMKARTK